MHSCEADVVVADNGSTDGSVEWVSTHYPQVHTLRLGTNYGFAEGYNRALAQLDGYDLFVLLNSDVEPTEGWLQPLIAHFEDESVAIVGSKILSMADRDMFEYAGASGGFIDYLGYPFCRGRILNHVEEDVGQYNDTRDVMWVGGAALCCRAEVYRRLNGLCGDYFAHMEEIDLCWRAQLSGMRVVVEPHSVVYHLGGGTLANGSAQKIYLNHRNNLAMLYRCAPPMQRAVVAVVRPLLDVAAAFGYLLHGNVQGFKAVLRALWSFAGWHKRLSAERRVIRGNVISEAKGVYCGSIVVRYLAGWRKFDKLM
jgi:GT2 family glycosyltransferase